MLKKNGFSLIEVSVASLLIMLGVTGYVRLQSEYIALATTLNLRTLALHIAQEKLTDLALFQQTGHLNGKISYHNIATNLGGRIPAGERDMMLSSELNMHTYDTQWQVENVYYVDTNFDDVADSWVKVGEPFYPIDLPRNPHLKNVHVIVTWLDINGVKKKLEMFGSIAPIVQSQSFQAKYRSSSVLAIP
jgi:hypothetical protein